MWTILDYMIIGILIAVASFVFRIIFKLSEKIQMGIFIILFGFPCQLPDIDNISHQLHLTFF